MWTGIMEKGRKNKVNTTVDNVNGGQAEKQVRGLGERRILEWMVKAKGGEDSLTTWQQEGTGKVELGKE
jgi:hypothetical protein